jgi:hypothetical protein
MRGERERGRRRRRRRARRGDRGKWERRRADAIRRLPGRAPLPVSPEFSDLGVSASLPAFSLLHSPTALLPSSSTPSPLPASLPPPTSSRCPRYLRVPCCPRCRCRRRHLWHTHHRQRLFPSPPAPSPLVLHSSALCAASVRSYSLSHCPRLYTPSPSHARGLRTLRTLTISCTSPPSLMRPHCHSRAHIHTPHRLITLARPPALYTPPSSSPLRYPQRPQWMPAPVASLLDVITTMATTKTRTMRRRQHDNAAGMTRYADDDTARTVKTTLRARNRLQRAS